MFSWSEPERAYPRAQALIDAGRKGEPVFHRLRMRPTFQDFLEILLS